MKKEEIAVVYSDESTGFVSPSSTCFRESKSRELMGIKVGDEIWVETYSEQLAGPVGYAFVTVTEIKRVDGFREVFWENEHCSGMTKIYPFAPHRTKIFRLKDRIKELHILKAAA